MMLLNYISVYVGNIMIFKKIVLSQSAKNTKGKEVLHQVN